MRRQNHSCPVLPAALTLAALLFPAAASAQNALGDGRSLDNNPRVGSGGLNTRSRDVRATIRAANDVVTGNAAAGKSFRGGIPYLAADDFRGSLGSNDLFRFRRDSTLSAIDQTIRSASLGADTHFRTSSAGVLTAAAVDRSGAGASGRTLFAPSRSDLYQDLEYAAPQYVGSKTLASGQQVALTASSLRGLSMTPITSSLPIGQAPSPTATTDPADPSAAAAPSASAPQALGRIDTSYQTLLERIRESGKTVGLTPPAEVAAQPDPSTTISWLQTEIDKLRASLRDDPLTADPFAPRMPAKKPADDSEKVPDSVLPDAPDAPDSVDPVPDLERITEALKLSKVTVDSLAAPKATSLRTYNDSMARGQESMRERRYFDAEGAFALAVRAKPDDTMARVGQVHAALGAGLYASAGLNLRELLIENPELAPLRYAPHLLPAPESLAEALPVLRRQTGTVSRRAADAAILLAYIGYQTADKPLTEEALDLLTASVDPSNTAALQRIALARAIWLSDDPPAPVDAPPPPAPIETPSADSAADQPSPSVPQEPAAPK